MNHNAKLFGFFLLIPAVIVFGPLLSIWALNTLFPVLAIPYTIETWAAVILIAVMPRVSFSTKKD
jgi:5-bromo-4-chloroindolyl phosphate hydrolysis protein